MAIETFDRTTQDLFNTDIRLGRPRSNPLPRNEQLRQNKRMQVKRDNAKGIKRIELKVAGDLLSRLNDEAQQAGINRSLLIERLIRQQLQM